MSNVLYGLLLCLVSISLIIGQDVDNLDDLILKLKDDRNSRIGVLSKSNFDMVKKMLPSHVSPLVVEHEEDLVKLVLNGTLIAGLTSGLPEQKYHASFHIFPSGVIALHSILMAPENSTEFPNGVAESNLSSKHLAEAINAAIVQLQYDNLDQQIAKKNGRKEISQTFTCKGVNKSHFNLPNRANATGLLKSVLESRKLKVLCQGQPNWGNDDGNYQVGPPYIGFYPDYLERISEIFQQLSGPDKKLYGKIEIERIFTSDTKMFPWYKLFNGEAHMTEPYFLLDGTYSGSGKNCSQNNDCLPSKLENITESCSNGFCVHPERPRILMLRSTCTTVGTESMFYTKKSPSSSPSQNNGRMSPSTKAYIVIISLLCVVSMTFLGFLIFRERYGVPLFRYRY